MKESKLKLLNKIVIVCGIIFILLSAFHPNIWFDESYSVAIANHTFTDIWNITGHDVHPALYYWMIHILDLIFGSNIIIYRLFSILAVVITGILGYTHIRKDFGEKVGLLFSFLCFFLPIMSVYAQEIRMYSWSFLFVTLLAIYGYRFYKNIKDGNDKKQTNKNLILFGIFSICCLYIHYYAVMVAFIINLILFVYLFKNRKKLKNDLIKFTILGIIQVLLYIPWMVFLVGQVSKVSKGFWINLDLNTLLEVSSFQFKGNLGSSFNINIQTIIPLIAAIGIYIYIGFKVYKERKDNNKWNMGILSFLIYLTVIIIMLIISLIKTPILFARYLFVLTGLYIFFLAYYMSKEKNNKITICICSIIVILATVTNVVHCVINYDKSNMKQIEYLKENINESDIIIYPDIGNGGVIAALLPNQEQYFYNRYSNINYIIEEAYEAYGPNMKIVKDFNFLQDTKINRIWVVDLENLEFYNEYFNNENYKLIEDVKKFDTMYNSMKYRIVLVEKVK